MSRKIAVLGSSNTDMIIKVPRIPKPGETILGGEFAMAAGGKGANQAVASARLGGAVTFLARVGDDMFGEQAIQGFVNDGVNIEYIQRDSEAPSGVALIFVAEDGENSIAVASGANANLSPDDIEAVSQTLIDADILLMQLETPIETVKKAAAVAANNGVKVIINPAPAQSLDKELLKCISILTPNESEIELLTGVKCQNESDIQQGAKKLMAQGVEVVIVTLGFKGAMVVSEGISRLIPAFRVRAIDTTAAGDVFNGALAVALAEGRTLANAILFANAAAALSVTKLGAQTSAPHRDEVEELLKRNLGNVDDFECE